MKKYVMFSLNIVLTVLGVLVGGGAMMAIAGSVSDADAARNVDSNGNINGKGISGKAGSNANGGTMSDGNANVKQNYEGLEGISSQTENDRLNAAGADDFDARGLSKKILELQPMKTPFDQLTRHASSGEKPEGMKMEYASIGSRPTETEIVTNAFSISSTAQSGTLYVKDPAIFSIDDVILVPNIKAVTSYDGTAYANIFKKADGSANPGDGRWPCLQLKVCGYDDSNSMPVVYAMNGVKYNGQNIQVGTGMYKKVETTDSSTGVVTVTWEATTTIPTGTKLLRIAKAVNEGASQTGRTAELPKTDLQYLQIFMTQTEESLIHKLTKRDVNGLDLAWHERRTLEDMRMVQEGTFLFSDMACIKNHPKENLNKVWATKGAWYQAGKDVPDIGTKDAQTGEITISDNDLVDLAKELFVGEGTGGKKKLLFCGSAFIQALEKITSDKFRLKGDVQAWNLTFTSWKTTFGEVLAIHDETLDKYGKEDCAFSLDPEYFEKVVLLSMDRNTIDLNAMGVRATEAVVLKEISAVVLYAPQAHARLYLTK